MRLAPTLHPPQVAYSPPYGDYMSEDYADRYTPHLKIIKKLFNTVRLYNLQLDIDHTPFLDACHRNDLMVIVTFWMDSVLYPNLDTAPEDAMVNFRYPRAPPTPGLAALGRAGPAPSHPRGHDLLVCSKSPGASPCGPLQLKSVRKGVRYMF